MDTVTIRVSSLINPQISKVKIGCRKSSETCICMKKYTYYIYAIVILNKKLCLVFNNSVKNNVINCLFLK